MRKKIEDLLNENSAENNSNTPDFVLARFLVQCLNAFDAAVNDREHWYGRTPELIEGLPHDPGPTDLNGE